MAAALELVDLAALLAEAVAWALVVLTILLLKQLVSHMHWKLDLGIGSFEPLGWLADAITSYIVAGAEDARSALEGAMKATFDGLVWSFDELLAIFTDLADSVKNALVYLWRDAVRPWTQDLVKPIRQLATKTEAELDTLTGTVAADLVKAEKYAEDVGWKRLADAEGFTKTEIAAARRDAAAALGTFETEIHTAEAGAIAIPDAVGQDFESLWKELQKYVRPTDLEKLLGAGLLSGMLLRVLAQASGLDTSECQGKHKQICGTDPGKWTSFLEGLVLLGFAFDFRELVKFAESLAGDVLPVVEAVK